MDYIDEELAAEIKKQQAEAQNEKDHVSVAIMRDLLACCDAITQPKVIRQSDDDDAQVEVISIEEQQLEVIIDNVLNGIKNRLITGDVWLDIRSAVEELVRLCRVIPNDYMYLFNTMMGYESNLVMLEGKLTGSDNDKATLNRIAGIQHAKTVGEKMIRHIIDYNLAHLLENEKLIKLEYSEEYGDIYTLCSDAAYLKSRPSIFPSGRKDSPLLYSHLEGMARNKSKKGVSFRKLPSSFYNMAPNPSLWLQPVFGQSHHEFFDILFECLAQDIDARQRLLDCIAWKYRRPWIITLPSPVFCGVGGAGKSGVGIIFKTIVGRNTVNWAAKITDDSMKNTGFMVGKWIVNFDDLLIIKNKSKEFDFIKSTCFNPTFIVRDLFEKSNEADMTAWIWFNGNPAGEDKCPVPLEGDGATGVDRRFMPFIIRKSLIQVYQEHYPNLSVTEAKAAIDYHFNNTCTNREEVAKWLGNIVEKSNVDNLTDKEHPITYHGNDYKCLAAQVSKQVNEVFSFVFEQQRPDFISVKDLYSTYVAHYIEDGGDPKFKKQKTAFTSDINTINNTVYQYGKWNTARASGGSQICGWRLPPVTNKNGQVPCVDPETPEWLSYAKDTPRIKDGYDISSAGHFKDFAEREAEKVDLAARIKKLRKGD